MHSQEHLEDKSYNFIRVNAVVMNNSLVLGVIIPVLESSTYNISLHELKKTTTATQRWLKTCKKDKEAEEVKRPHGFN